MRGFGRTLDFALYRGVVLASTRCYRLRGLRGLPRPSHPYDVWVTRPSEGDRIGLQKVNANKSQGLAAGLQGDGNANAQ